MASILSWYLFELWRIFSSVCIFIHVWSRFTYLVCLQRKALRYFKLFFLIFFLLYIKHWYLSISILIHRFSTLFTLNLIALRAKGIKYEYKEGNLLEKSPLLLMSVYMKIPVLIHSNKPICERTSQYTWVYWCGLEEKVSFVTDWSLRASSNPYEQAQGPDLVEEKVFLSLSISFFFIYNLMLVASHTLG